MCSSSSSSSKGCRNRAATLQREERGRSVRWSLFFSAPSIAFRVYMLSNLASHTTAGSSLSHCKESAMPPQSFALHAW